MLPPLLGAPAVEEGVERRFCFQRGWVAVGETPSRLSGPHCAMPMQALTHGLTQLLARRAWQQETQTCWFATFWPWEEGPASAEGPCRRLSRTLASTLLLELALVLLMPMTVTSPLLLGAMVRSLLAELPQSLLRPQGVLAHRCSVVLESHQQHFLLLLSMRACVHPYNISTD